MKIRTLIAQCAAAGAIAAGSLTLTTGTAHAAVNCNYVRSQITFWRTAWYNDLEAADAAMARGDWDAANFWSTTAGEDRVILDSYQNQLSRCA